MTSKSIAAITKLGIDQPDYISVNELQDGSVSIVTRVDGNGFAIVLTEWEFKALAGQIVAWAVKS